MKFGLETKVGIFVVATTVLIAALSIVFGKIEFGKSSGYDIIFEISDASGLTTRTSVYYRGVKVGKIKTINLKDSDLFATVTIANEYQIPNNIVFTIRQAGFVGEKFVELVASPSLLATGMLEPGKTYFGNQSATSIDAVVAKVDKLASEITLFVEALNKVFTKDNTTIALYDSIQNVKSITDNIDKLIEANQRNITKTISNIEDLTAALRQIANSNNQDINEAIKNVKQITDKLNSAMDDVKSITRDIDEGKGTIGLLVNDNQTKDDVRAVISAVSGMMKSFDEYKLYITFGADYMFEANNARGYANIKLYTKPYRYYLLGISNTPSLRPTKTTKHVKIDPKDGSAWPTGAVEYDQTEYSFTSSSIAFSLQYGHIFDQIVGVRVGLFDSTLGAAIDIFPLKNEDLLLSAEAYDFSTFSKGIEVYTRAYIKWCFWENLFIQVGVEDILNNYQRVYTIGGGLRFADNDLKTLAGSAASAVPK